MTSTAVAHSCRGSHDVHDHHTAVRVSFSGLCDACFSIAWFAAALATNHLAGSSVWVSLPS